MVERLDWLGWFGLVEFGTFFLCLGGFDIRLGTGYWRKSEVMDNNAIAYRRIETGLSFPFDF